MRNGSVSTTPLRAGRGFLLLGAVLLGSMMPAHAAVTVTLKVEAVASGVPVAMCATSVPAGADGVAVLEAALQSGCIAQYRVETFPFGRYVSCIDFVCDVPWRHADVETGAEAFSPVYWGMKVDGECTGYGVNDFDAVAGRELSFTFTTWLPFLVDSNYCPL